MSHGLYITSVFIHVISACVWVGGMLFLILAFIPGIKNQPDKVDIIAKVSLKFRTVGAIALALLLITGIIQLEFRGVEWSIAYFAETHFGRIAGLKILVFIGIIGVSLVHDYYLGNLAVEAWKKNPTELRTLKLRNLSRLLGRVSFLLALIAVFLGVIMVRGW